MTSLVRAEVERRFGDSADIVYLDTSKAEVQQEHADIVTDIKDRGLIYPVTVVDGTPMYDGAVSYPAIMRAIESRIGSAASVE